MRTAGVEQWAFTYNGNTVVVDVSLLVELLLDLSVLPLGSGRVVSCWSRLISDDNDDDELNRRQEGWNSLDTTGVEVGLVDVAGHHVESLQCGRMEVVLLLLLDLLTNEILFEDRSRRYRTSIWIGKTGSIKGISSRRHVELLRNHCTLCYGSVWCESAEAVDRGAICRRLWRRRWSRSLVIG